MVNSLNKDQHMFNNLPPTMKEVITNLLHAGDFVAAKKIYDRFAFDRSQECSHSDSAGNCL